jgi:hypothetical protein
VIRRINENRKRHENVDSVRKNYNTSKISEWLKGDQEEIIKEESEIKKETSWNSYRDWIIVLGLIFGSVVVYIYFDEIKDNSVSLWEWITSFRSSNNGDGTNNEGSNTNENNRGNITANTSDQGDYSDDIQMINRITSPSCDNYYLDESIMDRMIDKDGPGVIVKYNEINLF